MDFHGGLFHFQDGVPTTIIPQRGDVLIYRAEDMHSVDEVTHGERCTLALWFTLDSSCDEDAKILNSIRPSPMNSSPLGVHDSSTDDDYPNESMWKPLPASNSMYIMHFADESKERKRKRTEPFWYQFDLRVARSRELGFEFCIVIDKLFVAIDTIEGQPYAKLEELQDALEGPLKVKSNGQVVPYVFANSIHALQVLYFCKWKASEEQGAEIAGLVEVDANGADSPVSPANMHMSFLCGKVSGADDDKQHAAGGAAKTIVIRDILESVLRSKDWEEYLLPYRNELERCFPVWNHFKCISAHVSK